MIRDRIRGSLLPRIVLVLIAILVVSSAVTWELDRRLTRTELERQAASLLEGKLDVLRAALTTQQADLVTGLRGAGQRLVVQGPLDPRRRADLVAELGRTRRDLRLDLVNVLDDTGEVVVAIQGRLAALPPPALLELEAGPQTWVLRTADGRYARIALVRVVRGDDRFVLAGGYLFDDAAAYRLRRLVGGDIVLAAARQLVGSSLAEPPGTPPLLQPDGSLPPHPAPAAVAGRASYVGYTSITPPAGEWAPAAAVGVVMADPVSPLNVVFARNRLIGLAALMLIAVALGWLAFRRLTRPLLALADTARRVASGDLAASFVAGSSDEIGRLASSLEAMRRELRDQLRLIESQAADLRESSRRIVGARDQERRRLAADLHDGLQRQLIMLRLHIGTMAGALARDPGRAPTLVTALADEVERVTEELRGISHAIFPSILADRGLGGALHSLGGRAPIPVLVRTSPEPLPRLGAEVEANAYFLISEAVANALKHADASRIEVDAVVEAGLLRVSVADDGRGFDAQALAKTNGLTHMRDRARAAGGDMLLATMGGGGTEVRAFFPLAAGAVSQGAPLQVEQDRGHAAVDVGVLVEPQLGEDGADVLLHGPLGHGESGRDRGVAFP